MSVNKGFFIRRYAFSLIELLIVIVIMGLVYTLALSNLDMIKQKSTTFFQSIKDLKKYLFSFDFEHEIRYVCINNCQHCVVVLDNNAQKEAKAFFSHKVVSYYFDPYSGYTQEEYEPFFNKDNIQEDVCFSLRAYKDGNTEQLAVVYDKKVYDFAPYKKVDIYNSLDELSRKKEQLHQKVYQ